MITMEDIARMCGVSRQTVHAALNGKVGVSVKTRQRILAVCKEYNYQPNRLATTLHRKTTQLVGLTILNIKNPFFGDLIQGIGSVLRERDLHLLFFETPDKDEEEEAVATLLAYQAAGLILSPVQDETRVDHLRALRRRGTPFVTIGPVRGLETDCVEVDNEQVAALATELLLRQGHRRLCYLEGPRKIISAQERSMGFIRALMDHGIEFDSRWVLPGGETTDSGRAAAISVLSRPARERPTGIVCFNDIVAIGVYEAAQELGVRIPQDVSVVGCDDIELARLLGPPLTTVALPIREMGVAAANMLVEQMSRARGEMTGESTAKQLKGNGEESAGQCQVHRFTPRLVERDSVRQMRTR